MGKRGRKKKKVLPRLRLKPETVQTVLFIFFLILSILSVFSFLQTGPIPTGFNELLTSIFGFSSIFVPFLLVLVSFLFAKIKSPLKELNVFLGFMVMFISVTTMFKQGSFGQLIWDQFLVMFGEVPSVLIFF